MKEFALKELLSFFIMMIAVKKIKGNDFVSFNLQYLLYEQEFLLLFNIIRTKGFYHR